MDFFNTLSNKSLSVGVGSSGGGVSNGGSAGAGTADKVLGGGLASPGGLAGVMGPLESAAASGRLSVKEEPLSEEDLRALQKDRQKKDNHNMSKSSLD